MTVTWLTKDAVGTMVLYGSGNLNSTAYGTSTPFETGARSEIVHRATLTGLTPGGKYGKSLVMLTDSLQRGL